MTTEQEIEPDWAARQTDRVIDVIDKVKAQTTDRAVTVLRAVVFGLVIAVLGVAGVMPLALVVALTGLEILIAFLQAYVFAILTCLYINDAIHLH